MDSCGNFRCSKVRKGGMKMKAISVFTPLTQIALSHLLLRILCLLIIEHECAQLVQESSGTPAVMGNYILASIYSLGLILCMVNLKAGLIVGMIASGINILAKVIIIFGGHEHFPYYPIVWITQCLLVAYFCYMAFNQNQHCTR